MQVIPAIQTGDLDELKTLIQKAEEVVDRVQIDIVDGQFAKNQTIDPKSLKQITTNLNFDYHLMVKDPINWLDNCIVSPSNTIIGHIEYMKSQPEFVNKVKSSGVLAGLAVDLATPLYKLDHDVLSSLDILLLMSIPAGFGGQQFDLSAWDKIAEAVGLRNQTGTKFKLAIDGGVTKEIIKQMSDMGVDEVYVGNRIFSPDLKENLKLFSGGE